jgi:hypothetical protein
VKTPRIPVGCAIGPAASLPSSTKLDGTGLHSIKSLL